MTSDTRTGEPLDHRPNSAVRSRKNPDSDAGRRVMRARRSSRCGEPAGDLRSGADGAGARACEGGSMVDAALVFAVNLPPALGPPTWTVLDWRRVLARRAPGAGAATPASS
jgi:hypothetical protein